MNKTELVRNMITPWACIGKQLEKDADFADRLSYVKDADKYDWYQMKPRVTYDDWIVCMCKTDGKFYRIDLENFVIEEVVVAEVLEIDDRGCVIDENDCVIKEDNLFDYCDNICCGQSDCMNYYIYFNLANK